jgi:hypothetical protein
MFKYWWIFLCLVSCATQQKHQAESAPEKPIDADQKAPTVGKIYRERYHFTDAKEKLVDNKGEGPKTLTGTRNFRAVLNGVYYRGGANNKFRKEGKRENSNPLPPEGLKNLCQEGFSDAVYLYQENFSQAEHEVSCRTFTGRENKLRYQQVSPLKNKRGDLEKLLKLIYQHVKQPELGPVYDHCWNGWHASGLVAAAALRQFCSFTAEQALAYWIQNTDGDANYPKVQKRVKEFETIPGMQLSPQERKTLCPDPETLKFPGSI